VNFDESEPATFKDRYLSDYDPHVMLEGIAIAGYANSIATSYIFIRGEYHTQATIVEEAVREAYANGIFGVKHPGTEIVHQCYVHRGAGAYICGEETGLLEALEGKRGLAANQAAVSGRRRCLCQAHDHQQRGNLGLSALHRGKRSRGI